MMMLFPVVSMIISAISMYFNIEGVEKMKERRREEKKKAGLKLRKKMNQESCGENKRLTILNFAAHIEIPIKN